MNATANQELNLLQKLVFAAGWHSDLRQMSEALPHMATSHSAEELLAALRNIGVPYSMAQARLSDLAPSDCPAMFLDQQGTIYAVLDQKNDKVLICHKRQTEPGWQSAPNGHGTLIKLERFAASRQVNDFESFGNIVSGFRGLLPWLLIASFMTNLMGLVTPLLIMVIYDRVIPTGSVALVVSLVFGAALVLATDAGFRFARSSAVAYMGRIVEHRLGLALFQKLVSLPLSQIQKSDVEQQISRFKQFEGLRDFFSGQVLTIFLDLPFTLIFLGVLFVLAPQVALLIMCLALVFVVAICTTLPIQKKLNAAAAKAKADHQSLMFETVTQQRNIYRLGLGTVWRQRHASSAQSAAQASRKARRFQLVSQSFGQSLMTVAGVGAIALGTLSAMEGAMSFGALIAVMSLVWKVLTPLQSLFSNAPQILGFVKSKQQVDRLLKLPEEFVRGAAKSHQKSFEGRVSFSGVSYRYPGATEPALTQVSLEIEAGEFVVIYGNNSSGKTSLFHLMMGLFQPTVGTIQMDDIDLRQIAVDDLRQTISYAPKKPEVFHGTLLQNFLLAAPTASRTDIQNAIETVGLTEEVAQFPDGLDTRLTETYRRSLSPTTSCALSLARCFVRPSSLYLLNEPNSGLDYMRKTAVTNHLAHLKGEHTIIVASDDPHHIKLADRCIYLANGRVVSNDTGAAGQKKLNALIAANKEH